MNPYLEHPDLWPDVHHKLIQALAESLSVQLPPRYHAVIRRRIYRVTGEDALVVGTSEVTHAAPSGAPAAQPVATGIGLATRVAQPISVYVPVPQEIREDYIEIIAPTLGEVITVIEVLTPQKKRSGRGRKTYEQHRESILGSPTHFVEIDLLRGWEPIAVYGPDHESDYRILVSRSEQRPKADLYTWNVNDPIPLTWLPLTDIQEEFLIDLKPVLDQVCRRSDYDAVIDYQREPLPPLPDTSSCWLTMFLSQLGLR
jgi:hypothetical protein